MPPQPPAHEAPRVLIVDDEPSLRFGLGHTLARRGFTVATAATAEEARSKAASFRPTLVLLDLRLPDEDGLALVAELRRREPPPRVVVMTGFAPDETAEAARKSGAALVFQKPMEMDELLLRLEALAAGEE